MGFPLGALVDPPDPRDLKAATYLERAGASTDAAGLEGRQDWRLSLAPVVSQRGNSCVPEADLAAVDGQARIKGLSPEYGDALALYAIIRQLTSGPIAALTDTGSIPRLGAKAISRWGIVKRGTWNPDDINQHITQDVLHEGAAQVVEAFHRIEGLEDDIATQICAALDMGILPTYVQPVDDLYERLVAGEVYSGPIGPVKGYHAQCIVGYDLHGTEPVLLVRNSWRPFWADGGYARVHLRFVAGGQCRDRWVFEQAPVVR